MSAGTLKLLLRESTPDLKKINRSIGRIMKRPKLQKLLLKVMIKTWSEDEDSRRVLALLNILKATSVTPSCCALCIKLMYAAYVRNCKFVLGSTVAHINFMRLSFLEVFSQDLDETYLHAFAYIRQLAISIRKAQSTQSKADVQNILNWQFVCSLRLWVETVAKFSHQHKLLASLTHPLVQLLMGLTKFNSGERWIPLRFHCVTMLHILAGVPTLSTTSETSGDKPQKLVGRALSSSSRILVPSVPLLLDVFQLVNFNRRSVGGASRAPLDLRLLLHFTPSQRRETGSLDAIVSWLCDLIAEAAAIHANSLAFPEYALPIINELKHFCSTCRVASFTRQMKALLVKLREHSEWIDTRRRRVRNLANTDELAQVEHSLSASEDSPFLAFYSLHKEVRSKELARLTENHQKDASNMDDTEPKVSSKYERQAKRAASESESEASSDDSNDSYDLDDGSTLTHVSKSKPAEKVAEDSSSESDFDLEAALKEEDDDGAAEQDIPPLDDVVSDFALSDSEAEILTDDDDEELPKGVQKHPVVKKRKKLKQKSALANGVRTKRRKKN